MYGLVNRAIEEMIITNHGDQAWEDIKERAGFRDEGFLSQRPYDDAVTYQLVEAASVYFAVPAPDILASFGEYWVRYTGRAGYGYMFELGGRSLPAFLSNLNALHTRVAIAMTDASMPVFECTDLTRSTLRLHYRSTRNGLAPLVIGILRGLGDLFDTKVSVVHEFDKSRGADHDVFLVEYAPVAQ